MKEHHGLAKQFIRIIALAALESVLLLTVSQVVLAKGLRFWFSRTEVQQHAHPETGAGAAELCDRTSPCQYRCKGIDRLEP